jgi:alanyl aminopeptidase
MRSTAVALAAIAACSSPTSHTATTTTTAAPAPTAGSSAAPVDAPAPTLRLPASFHPKAYVARLRIDPATPRFDGTLRIDATLDAPTTTIWLDAEDLTIDQASVRFGVGDGRNDVPVTATAALAPSMVGAHFLQLRADRAISAGNITVELAYHGALNDQEHRGAWRNPWHGDWYVFTQFEAIAARRVFPCVDEPGSKVVWQLALEVPAADVALSNTAGRETAIDASWKRVEFAPTRPLPSYLVAFAIGPMELVDAGKSQGGRAIRIAAPKGRAAEAAYAAKSTAPIVDRLEAWFGSPLPYDKLDQVAIPANSGAMENAGMITYAETRILIPPSDPSDSRRKTYAAYAAHEIAHHWFGDLVTTAWWDDLWLNEAFASWMESKILAQVEPAWRGDLEDVERLGSALRADELVSARMIQQPITAEDDIVNAFDGITYDKGASVIRMFERWVGAPKFQDGVRAYLAKHADGNATTDEFLAAIGLAAGKDVATPFKTFLTQAGAPRVTATITCPKAEPVRIALHQERYLPRGAATTTAQTWMIPVCIASGEFRGGRASRTCTMFADIDGSLPIPGPCPSWVYANADASGYYHVGLTADGLAAIAKDGWPALHDAERLELAVDVMAGVDRGDLDVAAALELVPQLLATQNGATIEAAVRIGARVEAYVPPAQRAGYQAWIRRTYGPLARKLGWTAATGDTAETERMRIAVLPLVAITGGDPTLRKQAVALARDWQALPSGMTRAIVGAAAEDPKAFATLLAAVHTVKDRRALKDLIAALVGVHDLASQAKVLALGLDPSIEWGQVVMIASQSAADPASSAAATAFVTAHLDELRQRTPVGSRAAFAYLLTHACDAASRDDAAKRAEPMRAFLGGPRIVSQAIEEMDQCIAQKAMQGPALARYFAKK